MLCLYIGDASKDVISRILTNHCSGNVEGSSLRESIAQKMGYSIVRTRRPSGTTKVRIDLVNPKEGESKVSDYIRSGKWKYMVCQSFIEAHDFQWYLIDRLKPLLNRDRRPWKKENFERYSYLFSLLEASPMLIYSQLRGKQSGPGVYVLYHEQTPWSTYQNR